MATSALALLADYEERQRERTQSRACVECHQPLQETVTGNRPTDDGCVCSDCYYEELGALVEQRPITSGRAHRG